VRFDRNAILIAVLLAFAPNLAVAEDIDGFKAYYPDCTQNDALPPENIIVACKSGIKLKGHENWGDTSGEYFYIALADERRGLYKQAQAEFFTQIAIRTSDDRLWRHFVEVSGKLGQPPGMAMALLDELEKKYPNDLGNKIASCWVRATFGEGLDTALADCDAALRITPDDPLALHGRCFVHFRRGEYPLAIGDCNRAADLFPKGRTFTTISNSSQRSGADPLYVRGLLNLRMGHTDLGNADIAAAKAIDPKIAETYAVYGVTP
jgi:tetratricopeptide (TPR) repeat protein